MTSEYDWQVRIPRITSIADPALRESVVVTWEAVTQLSGYSGPEEAPEGTGLGMRSLLLHTNEVTEMAALMAAFGVDRVGVEVDLDVLLAAAILHDVDKMVLFERSPEGEPRVSTAYDRKRDHGPVGAKFALEHGVPEAVAELVRFHSPFGGHPVVSSVEGTILHYADLSAADLGASEVGVRTIRERSEMILESDRVVAQS